MLITNERFYSGYKLATIDGSSWVRIFHHNSTNKEYFSTDTTLATKQVSYINEKNRFSVFGSINEKFFIDGLYNFMIYYPIEFPDNPYYVNQSSHPLYSRTVTNKIIKSSKPAKCTRYDFTKGCEFAGLAIKQNGYTIIDGNPSQSYWHYAIGAQQSWVAANGIPGPLCDGVPVYVVDVWLRYNSFEVLKNLPNFEFEMLSNASNINYLAMLFVLPVYIDTSSL